MIDEKLLEKYYKGKLLCENYDRPLSFKILNTLQTCTTEEINPIDRVSWFNIIYKELNKVPPVEIDQPILLTIVVLVIMVLLMVTFLLLDKIKIKNGVLDILIGHVIKMIIRFILKLEIKVKKINIYMK